MSTLVAHRTAVRTRPARVVLELARLEGLRLIRHPIFIAGAILSVAFFGLMTWNKAPVLHRDGVLSVGALLPLAVSTLVVANYAAIRAARDGTTELYEGLPTDARTRTLGRLVSLLWGAAGAVVVLGVMFTYLALDAPVGTLDPLEVAAGPAEVVLFGATGIVLGRWRTHVAIAPIAALVLVGLEIVLIQPIIGLETLASRTPWLAPWVPSSLTGGVPPELTIRPAGWHLLYLAGLIAVAGAGAVLGRGRTKVVAVLVAGGLVASAGGFAQLRPASDEQRARLGALLQRPEGFQVCTERGGTEFCAYPSYVPWVDRWARAVAGALAPVPSDDRPTGLVVRQTFGTYFEGVVDVPKAAVRALRHRKSDDIEVGFQWGRWATEGLYEIGLTLPFTMRAVGLPTDRSDIRLTASDVELLTRTVLPQFRKERRARVAANRLQPGKPWEGCHTLGQARAVIALWLAAHATPSSTAAVEGVAEDNPYGVILDDEQKFAYYVGPFMPLYPISPGNPDWGVVSWTDSEFHYAARLLEQPEEKVVAALREDWDVLTDPRTSTDVVVDRFDLEPLTPLQEQFDDVPAGYSNPTSQDTQGEYLRGIPPCH